MEDDNLTAKIKIINNTVDISKVGTYTVIYKVIDKDGASVTKTITVTVKKEEQIPLVNSDIKMGESTNIILGGRDNSFYLFLLWFRSVLANGMLSVTDN